MWKIATNMRFLSKFRVFSFDESRIPCLLRRRYSVGTETSQNEAKYYDVVVSGGGMVGLGMACALGMSDRLSGKKFLLLEACSFKSLSENFPETYSNRVSSISPGTQRLMQRLGAWNRVERVRYCPVKRMQIWDACTDAMISFSSDESAENVAVIVENNLIKKAFYEQLEHLCKGVVELRDGSRMANCELPKNGRDPVRITLQDGSALETKLLIGADGSKSRVRSAMKAQYINRSYDQIGVVANLRLSEPTDNFVAWQRFLPDSTIALLPLTDTLSSLVWSTSRRQAKELLSIGEAEFIDQVNAALWSDHAKNVQLTSVVHSFSKLIRNILPTTGSVRQLPPSIAGVEPKSRAGFALSFGHSTHYVDHGVALVGDCAHLVHPLAGLGVNLGFGDIECLIKTIEDAVHSGDQIGSVNFLREYESERQLEVLARALTIDAVQKVFTTDFSPAVLARSVGMNAIDSAAQAKKFIMKMAAK